MNRPVAPEDTILSIDPGNVESAYCFLRGDGKIGSFGKVPNKRILEIVDLPLHNYIVCECIMSYGMPAGASLFDTCTFIGQIIERASQKQHTVTLMPRIQVKSHICHSGKATDSNGMPAGASLFDTCVFIGEIRAAALRPVTLIPRIQVKSHICHSGKATDSNIRQALIDLFGPQGKKSAPGPTFGISADVWSALAIAETFRSGDYAPYILSADKPENLPDKTA